LADEADSREEPLVFQSEVERISANNASDQDLREKGQDEGQSNTSLNNHQPTLNKNIN